MFGGKKGVPAQECTVTPRQIPAALTLGLAAALAAHSVLFGGEHAMGGAYNGALDQMAVGLLTAFGAFAGLLVAGNARFVSDGTVLAARAGSMVSGFLPVALATAGWFALGECIEPGHAGAPLLATLCALGLAAWLVLTLARGALKLLAGVVFAISRSLHVPHPGLVEGRLRIPAALRPARRDSAWWRARFLRPPPVRANA